MKADEKTQVIVEASRWDRGYWAVIVMPVSNQNLTLPVTFPTIKGAERVAQAIREEMLP